MIGEMTLKETGVHLSKQTGTEVEGSSTRAQRVEPVSEGSSYNNATILIRESRAPSPDRPHEDHREAAQAFVDKRPIFTGGEPAIHFTCGS